MAYTKLQKSPNLPAPSEEATAYERLLYTALSLYLNQANSVINDLVEGRMKVWKPQILNAEPKDIEEGYVAFADGTNWNPGTGRGLYEYSTGAWVKL